MWQGGGIAAARGIVARAWRRSLIVRGASTEKPRAFRIARGDSSVKSVLAERCDR
jgi:hypothetical protein